MGDNQSMAKEQIIYLLPEEELTNVRERLENTHAGRIILVIPPQTQLRSHVGWRLLRTRVLELGQDVLIISSDRQIRAVAKAAGFRVAESLESPPSDRPRPINRPVRSDMSGKTTQGTNKQASSGNEDTRPLGPDQQQMPQSSSKKSSTVSSSSDMNKEFDTPNSSAFKREEIPYDSHYALPIETVPPPRSGAGDQEEGEIDSFVEDYYVARNIREAAQSSDSGEASSDTDITGESNGTSEPSRKIPPPNEIEEDPFAYMEDIQPIALPEQQTSTPIHDIDQGIPDISDVPTDVQDLEIEDLGDKGEGMLQHDVSPHARNDQMLEESDVQETPRISGMTPRSSRMGNAVRPSLEDLGNEEDLLPPSIPIQEKPTRITPSSPVRSSSASTPSASRREPQPIIQSPPQVSKKQMLEESGKQETKPYVSRQPQRPVLSSQEVLETVVERRMKELHSTGVYLAKFANRLSIRAMTVKTVLIFLGVLVASLGIAMQLFGVPNNSFIVIYMFIGVLIATWAGLEAAFKWEGRAAKLKNVAARCQIDRRKHESAIYKADTTPDRESLLDALDKQLAEAKEKAAALGVNVVLDIPTLPHNMEDLRQIE